MSFRLDPYEKKLVEGCLLGQQASYKALYDRYKDAMYTILYQISGDKEDAADLLQEAFLEVFKHLPSYQEKASLGSWIKTIVVRKGVRSRKKYIRFSPLGVFPEPMGFDQTDANMSGYELEKCLLNLSDGYRAVFLLIEIYGYTHRETAEMLDIAEGTSKSQLARAKKKLQLMVKELQN